MYNILLHLSNITQKIILKTFNVYSLSPLCKLQETVTSLKNKFGLR